MKKILFLLSGITIVLNTIQAQKNVALHENPLFISTLIKQADLSALLENTTPYNRTNAANAEMLLKQYQTDIKDNSSTTNSEMYSKMSKIFNLANETALEMYLTEINNNLRTLQNEYGSGFNFEYIKTEIEKTVSNNSSLNTRYSPNKATNNGAYASCVAVAFSTAALGYAGCVGTIFGAPICMGLVLIYQTAAIHQCSVAFQS